AATVERLAGHLGTLLAAALASPATPLSALPLLGEAERHHLLAEQTDAWEDAGVHAPAAALHLRLAVVAVRSPAAVAAVCEDHALTYGELARRAGLLARRLRRLG